MITSYWFVGFSDMTVLSAMGIVFPGVNWYE
jgi:hypothetical protein